MSNSEVPLGWAMLTLGDVCDFYAGHGFPVEMQGRSNQQYPFYKVRDVSIAWNAGSRLLLTTENSLSEEEAASIRAKPVPTGAVVFAKIGEALRLNRRAITTIPSIIDNNLMGMWPEPELVDQKYLFLHSTITRFDSDARASVVPSIRKSDVSSIAFPLPPRAEQTRIVEKLEELLSDLDAGVAELKAAQRKLAQYRQSLLKAAVEGALTADWRAARHSYDYPPGSSSPRKRGSTGLAYQGVMDSRFRGNDVQSETGADLLQRILTERRTRWETRKLTKFTEQGKTPPKGWQAKYPEPVAPDTTELPTLPDSWTWASIEQVASDERYGLSIGPFGSNLKVSDYRESGVPLVFVRNIRNATYDGDKTKYVTPEKAASLHAHAIQGGDVLITKMGEPPGDADVYPEWLPPAIITADCIKVRCQQGLIHPSFLAASINSSTGRRQIGPITQGVAQKKVSLGRFISIAVPVPPLREQTEIVDLLTQAIEDADAQILAIEASLKQSAAQRKNILKAAFAGQLVPQDPNDEPASVLLERIRAAKAEHAGQAKPKAKRGRQA